MNKYNKKQDEKAFVQRKKEFTKKTKKRLPTEGANITKLAKGGILRKQKKF